MFVFPLRQVLQFKATREDVESYPGPLENQPANSHPALSNLQNELTEIKVSETQ
jgi:hypothetical protein